MGAGNKAKSFNGRNLSVLLGHFSSRIMASSVTWFVNDFAFYGNKLFQGTFIKIINPKAGLIEVFPCLQPPALVPQAFISQVEDMHLSLSSPIDV